MFYNFLRQKLLLRYVYKFKKIDILRRLTTPTQNLSHTLTLVQTLTLILT